MRRFAFLLFAAGLVLAGGSTDSSANWSMSYNGPTNYVARFEDVPDFDQRWVGLPGRGSMYCVPTSAFDWMAYIARHGYPMIEPGSESVGYWHSGAADLEIQNALLAMGVFMGTDAEEGTGPGTAPGIRTWLGVTGSNFLFNVHHVWLYDETPRFDDIAHWVRAGVPVMGTVGWYQDNGVSMVRDGGHVFAVVGVERSGNLRTLRFNDPAGDDDNRTVQSEVWEVAHATEERIRFVLGVPRMMDAVLDYEPGYIDGYTVIRPIAGLAKSSDGLTLKRIQPFGFSTDPNPRIDQIASPGGGTIVSVVPGWRTPEVFLTTGSTRVSPDPKLWSFDPVTGVYTELAVLDDPKGLQFDRFGRLFVLDGGNLRGFRREESRWIEVSSVVLPTVCTELAVDDRNDRLALLCDQRLLLYSVFDLSEQGNVDVPAGVPVTGDVSIAVSAEDGAYFLASTDAPNVFRFEDSISFTTIGSGLLGRPRDVTTGDDDCVYVVEGADDAVKVFCPSETGSEYEERADNPFASFAVGSGFVVGRSRTNHDPAVHDTPEFRNVLPRGVSTSVDETVTPGVVPSSLAIASVVPNPFNPRTTIFMDLPRATDVTLSVHDVRGRLVRTLHSGVREAGRHAVTWEGTDTNGRRVASGVYVVRLSTSDGEMRTQKITLAE